jgi:Ni/Co efflux regulator RcnB
MMTRNLANRLGVLAVAAALAMGAAAAEAAPRRDDDRRGQRQERPAAREWRDERRPAPQQQRYGRPYEQPPVNVRRGAFLPDDRRGAPVGDYNRARLRPPPQGYGWYRENGRYMLLDQYTGQVLDVVE